MNQETMLTQLGENMRFYADMRFKQISVLTAVLTVAAAGAIQFPNAMLAGQASVRTALASFALLLTAVVWIMEVRSTLFWAAHRDVASALWPTPTNAPFPWLTATNALLILYASLYGFWLYCALLWKLVTPMVVLFGVLAVLLVVFSVRAYLPLSRRGSTPPKSGAPSHAEDTPAMEQAAEHEKRSQEVADTLRRFLVAIHTGGIGALLAVAASLVDRRVHPRWAFWPVSIFVAGLVVIGVSLILAKHREIKRRDAAQRGESQPDFTGLAWRSQTWDTLSLVLFVTAAILGLVMLSLVNLGS